MIQTAPGTPIIRPLAEPIATNSATAQVDAFTTAPRSAIEVQPQMRLCRPKARNDAAASARNGGAAWPRKRTSAQLSCPLSRSRKASPSDASAADRSWAKMTPERETDIRRPPAHAGSSRRSPDPTSNGDVLVSAMAARVEGRGDESAIRSRHRLTIADHQLCLPKSPGETSSVQPLPYST
jgi:hypothetical protein